MARYKPVSYNQALMVPVILEKKGFTFFHDDLQKLFYSRYHILWGWIGAGVSTGLQIQ